MVENVFALFLIIVIIKMFTDKAGSSGSLQLDNIELRTRPEITVIGTECYEPASGEVSLILREYIPTLEATATLFMIEPPNSVTLFRSSRKTQQVRDSLSNPSCKVGQGSSLRER
jgi:hypothetical protein